MFKCRFLFINSLKFLHDLKEMKLFYDIQSEADIIEKALCRFDRVNMHIIFSIKETS